MPRTYNMAGYSTLEVISLVVIAFIVYKILLVLYRLTLHPLAGFPGPKLAAASSLYELYFDLVKKGQFIFEIERMHDKYGSIIRIHPDELHIRDSEFYDEIHSGATHGQKRDKAWNFSMQGNAPTSTAFTAQHDVHRYRRASLAPFFAKRAVTRLEPKIKEKVDILIDRMNGLQNSGEVVRLDGIFTALTTDIITEYCYGQSYNYLLHEDFRIDWKTSMDELLEGTAIRRATPRLTQLLASLPDKIAVKLVPALRPLLDFQNDIAIQAKRAFSAWQSKKSQDYSIFNSLLESDIVPPHEKTITHLIHEGTSVVAAGVETTAKALSFICFYVLSDPSVLMNLKRELDDGIPDPNDIPNWKILEQLPYLTGVIQEGIRLSYGLTTRSARLPHEALRYKDWIIPSMTPVSSIAYFVIMDTNIFPESEIFRPERWIENKRLDKYLVNFNKGTRICLGKELAYAELYLTVAAVFRKFDLELFETSIDDVKLNRDHFVSAPKPGSKGVRAMIKSQRH